MQRFDAVVVGAGPAGCGAALALVRDGLDVALLDASRFPREKVCGDGLSPRCMAVLGEMGLAALAKSAHQATTAHVVAPNGESVPFVTSSIGGLVRRAEFDAALVEHARARGAHVVPEARAVSIQHGPEGVVARTAGGRAFSGAWGVLATGTSPQGLKAAGLPMPAAPGAIGRRAYFEGADLPPRSILFDYARDLLPAYGWIFSLGDGAANVGVMTFVRPGGRGGPPLTERFEAFVRDSPTCRRFLAHARQVGPAGSASLRMGFDGAVFGEGRLLVAGDAAAGANPLTGEGIHAALVTGRLAAQAIARALREGVPASRAAAEYGDAVRRTFARDYAHAALTRRLMTRPIATNRFVRGGQRHPELADELVRVIVEGASPLRLLAPHRLVKLLV